MCGYSGLVFARPLDTSYRDRFRETAGRLRHRGGDGEGDATFAHAWISHHRLAFQDVAAGHQPFTLESGNPSAARLIFNGEIYNHLALRLGITRLSGHAFTTRSDTETLLAGFLAYGAAGLAAKLDGEYAFAVIEDQGRRLTAQRDAFGVKPLFLYLEGVDTALFAHARAEYRFETPLIAFASEMKALPAPRAWDRDGALRQFTGLFEPLRTPIQNVIALPAGATFEARLEARLETNTDSRGSTYACVLRLPETPVRDSALGSYAGAGIYTERAFLDTFATELGASVTDRLLSDVELGVYLSGGVDSKAVGHELGKHLRANGRPALRSFTIGFEHAAFDEQAEALSFARAEGFTPHALAVTDAELAYSYPIAVEHSENLQPYTNGAAKWWLSRFAREHVHGVLTGDGADELLCGYPSFRYCAWWKFAMRGRADNVGQLGSRWRDAVYVRRFVSQAADPWVAGASSAGRGDDFTGSLALWGVAHPLFGQIQAICRTLFPSKALADAWLEEQGPSVASWFTFGYRGGIDATDPENALVLWQNYFCKTHLPVQVLNWVGDRMEMANTLEGRTPFLSRRLREFTRGLGDRALVSGFLDKAVLRRAYVARLGAFARTPKKQFGAPFLDTAELLGRYPPHAALGAMGLDAQAVVARLLSRGEAGIGGAGPLDAFEKTHLQGALQTCVSLGIVARTLVDEVPVERDLAREGSVLARGKIFPT